MKKLVQAIEEGLLPQLHLESPHDHHPISVRFVPKPWKLLGNGNYAAVFFHPDEPERAVKVYAPGRGGVGEEAEVYRRLGIHPAYSYCYHAGDNYLILKRQHGVTLYDCLRRGIRIPEQAIRDIDEALDYARERGLHPHDVHGKNVMVDKGRGKVVDVSDFLKRDSCEMWDDFKAAYRTIYAPLLLRRPFPVPEMILNGVRRGYRLLRRYRR